MTTPTTSDTAREVLEAARASMHTVDLSWLDPQRERDSWTLADDTLRFAAALVERLRPTRILEFGSGVSTRLLAASAARLEQPPYVVALENDPVFHRRTIEDLARDAAPGHVRVELAHLVVRRCYGRNLPVYDLPASIMEGPPFPLVLVDGPPLPLGGRKGSLLQAVHVGGPGTLVLLDDAERSSEQEALALAERIFGDGIDVVHLEGFAKGLAAVIVRCEPAGSAMPTAAGSAPASLPGRG